MVESGWNHLTNFKSLYIPMIGGCNTCTNQQPPTNYKLPSSSLAWKPKGLNQQLKHTTNYVRHLLAPKIMIDKNKLLFNHFMSCYSIASCMWNCWIYFLLKHQDCQFPTSTQLPGPSIISKWSPSYPSQCPNQNFTYHAFAHSTTMPWFIPMIMPTHFGGTPK